MRKFPHLLVFAVFFGALIAYTGWTNQPPPESALASISGRVVGVERITRTRWDRRNLIPGDVYVGHDLAVRRETGEIVTVRVPDWGGIPEPRIEAMLRVDIRGRYDPRENVLYELAAGNNVLATYYSSSVTRGEDSIWHLLVGGAIAFAGLIMLGLWVSNEGKSSASQS